MAFQVRRGTNTERLSMTPVPAQGELIYTTDTKKLFVGDGVTTGGNPVEYFSKIKVNTAEIVPDNVNLGTITIAAGTGINLAADIITDTITINSTTAQAESFKYINIAGQSPIEADSNTDTLTLVAGSNILLTTDPNSGSITIASTGGGTASNSFTTISVASQDNIVASSSTDTLTLIAGTNLVLTTESSTKSLTLNSVIPSTISADLIGDSTGFHLGDMKGSVFGNDSTLIVDGNNSKIYADIDSVNVKTTALEIVSNANSGPGIVAYTLKSFDEHDFVSFKVVSNNPIGNGTLYARHRGSITNPTSVIPNDVIHSHVYAGWNNSNNGAYTAQIDIKADGVVTNTAVPGRIEFSTADSTGQLRLGLKIDRNQVLTVASKTVAAGGASGQVDTSTVASYLKIIVGSTTYALPLYALNP